MYHRQRPLHLLVPYGEARLQGGSGDRGKGQGNKGKIPGVTVVAYWKYPPYTAEPRSDSPASLLVPALVVRELFCSARQSRDRRDNAWLHGRNLWLVGVLAIGPVFTSWRCGDLPIPSLPSSTT